MIVSIVKQHNQHKLKGRFGVHYWEAASWGKSWQEQLNGNKANFWPSTRQSISINDSWFMIDVNSRHNHMLSLLDYITWQISTPSALYRIKHLLWFITERSWDCKPYVTDIIIVPTSLHNLCWLYRILDEIQVEASDTSFHCFLQQAIRNKRINWFGPGFNFRHGNE